MALDRLFRQTVRIDIAFPEAFANPATPTSAELNNAVLVKNITCALDEDTTEITLNDPDTDDSLSFCDAAGSQSPTFKNPSVVLSAYRDADRSASGIFDTALQLLAFKDIPYIAILRLGLDNTTAYATNQFIRMVGGKTDLPVSLEESGENTRIQNTILPDGFVNWNYKILS
jgi:hypothetical protein